MRASVFVVIGEQLHASGVLRRERRHLVLGPDGRRSLAFTGPDGRPHLLGIPDSGHPSRDGERVHIQHVRAALIAGMSGEVDLAASGRAYITLLVRRQIERGAAWLDLNVDEIAPDDSARQAAMRWLVEVVSATATVPLAIDSSSPGVLSAGVDAVPGSMARPLVNAVSCRRPELLDFVADRGCPVVLSAIGNAGVPTGVEERVGNALRMVELARGRGIQAERLFIDPLVLPVVHHPRAAVEFLAAVRALRLAFGEEIHLTGGLSNVSYGLPGRRLINAVFLHQVIAAGADSGILDPAIRHVGVAPDSLPWRLATDLLLGHDPQGQAFQRAHHAGLLDREPQRRIE